MWGCTIRPATGGSLLGVIPGDPPLHYETVGNGPALVVVLHGGPGVTHDYLRPEWDRLASVGEVVYYDQRGCGANPATGALTWQEDVADLDRLIRNLRQGRKVFLAGSSWGSELALRYAYLHPEGVDAVVLSGFVGWPDPARMRRWLAGTEPTGEGLDPFNVAVSPGQQSRSDGQSLPWETEFSRAEVLNPKAPRSIHLRRSGGGLPRTLFGSPVQSDTLQLAAEIRERVRRVVQLYGAVSLRRPANPKTGATRVYAMPPSEVGNDSTFAWRFPMICQESGTRTGLSRLGPPLSGLASIETPTLVISGGQGRLPDGTSQLVGVLPDLRIDWIVGGGHDAWHTRPNVFFPLVLEFLRARLASARQDTVGPWLNQSEPSQTAWIATSGRWHEPRDRDHWLLAPLAR